MQEIVVVFEQGGRPVTTSRIVAEHFEKQHQHVMRDIREIIDSPDLDSEFSQSKIGLAKDFSELNFELVDYVDLQGKPRPEYLITKDGFTLLVMGYTGAKAMQFKVAYINAFNKMEAAMQSRAAIPQEPSALESKLDVLISLMARQNAPKEPQITNTGMHNTPEASITQKKPNDSPVLPAMRTLDACIAQLQQDDPGCCLTRHAIRKMVLEGKIPHVRCGVKILVNYSKLLELLNAGLL